MPTFDAAIDPTLAPALVLVASGGMDEPIPAAPVAGPGDPDVEFDPIPASFGPRIEVEIGRAITREPIGFLSTAVVEEWDEDVELLAGSTATITASSSDPLWAEMAERSVLGADGRLKHTWDPKGYKCWIYRDGRPVATYIFLKPIDIGGGQVVLAAVGPQEQFTTRILGRAEQVDLLGDRGSFEGYSSIAQMVAAGWRFDEGVTATLVPGGVRGRQCLRVRGAGWVRSPWVSVKGAAGYGRVVDGQVFGRWHEDIPEGAVVARAYVQRADALTVSNEDYSEENCGVRPDEAGGWTEDPVPFAAKMSPQAVTHRAWAQVQSFDGVNSYYDLLQLRLSVQTGFPYGTLRDLADHVVRVLRDLNSRSLGGHPTGLTSRIVARCGVSASMRWSHAARTPVRDVLASILEQEGGPECRITPGWVLEVHDRLGARRSDVALSDHDVVAASWTTDPGAQVDDYVVDTGRGSGVNWLAAAFTQPARGDRWRIAATVQGPADRTLNDIYRWGLAHSRAAARQQHAGEFDVPWAVADQITTGDDLWAAVSDGDQALDARVRVLRKRYRWNGLCGLTWGMADA